MSRSSALQLPYILASQADKHVSFNEAISDLDVLVQMSVSSRSVGASAAQPVEGARFIVPSGATGTWSNKAGKIAVFETGAWRFIEPREGMQAWVVDEGVQIRHHAGNWEQVLIVDSVNPVASVGINTLADPTNRLAIKSDAVLMSHDPNGAGGIQLKLNKAQTNATGSVLFQTNWSTRGELGLCGDDLVRLKVSQDGSNFKTALVAQTDTGAIELPNGLVDPMTGKRALSLVPAIVKDIWRSDMDSPATPRTYVVASVVGDAVTITTNEVEQIFNTGMRDAAMVRIWNVSKTPAQAAWVKWNNAANIFAVHQPASVMGWASGDNLRLGDPNPTGTNTLQMVAIDISNYLYNNYGKIFPQRGLKLSFSAVGTGGRAGIDCSGTGAVGTALGSASNSDGSRQSSFVDVFTTTLSPISNSNLLFVREGFTAPATALGATRLLRLVGIWV